MAAQTEDRREQTVTATATRTRETSNFVRFDFAEPFTGNIYIPKGAALALGDTITVQVS